MTEPEKADPNCCRCLGSGKYTTDGWGGNTFRTCECVEAAVPAPEPSRDFLVDWAYGQVGLENDKVTREQVEKVVDDATAKGESQ